MTANSERLKRIQKRWNDEHRVSTADIVFLLDRAGAADTMQSANDLRNVAVRSGDGDLFDIIRKMTR